MVHNLKCQEKNKNKKKTLSSLTESTGANVLKQEHFWSNQSKNSDTKALETDSVSLCEIRWTGSLEISKSLSV